MIQTLIAVAVLMSTPVSPDAGHIWVRTIPGVVVTVDGERAGVTTEAAAGLQIIGVKTGRHEITLAIPGRGTKTIYVDVRREETSTVEVPAVGLRTQREVATGALEFEVHPFREPCAVLVGKTRYDLTEAWLRSEDLAAGKHQVVVTCGERSARKEVEVPADRTVLVRVNPVKNEIVVAGDRPRIVAVAVRTSRTMIEEAALPELVKRALIAGLSPGVEVIRISQDAAGITTIVFEMTNGYFSLGPLYRVPDVQILSRETERFTDRRWRLTVVFGIAKP